MITKTLRPFQAEDAAKMSAQTGMICGSEPGTGKTAVSIGLLTRLSSPFNLVVVPKSVLYQFQDEVNAFSSDLYPMVVTGSPAKRMEAYRVIFKLPRATLLLTYETLRADQDTIAAFRPGFGTIVFDEVHRLASYQTKTHKAIRDLLKAYKLHDVPRPRLYGFSASAIMNSPMDLFGIYAILQPQLFPNWKHFTQQYMFITPQGWMAGARASRLPELGRLIAPYYFRRTLAEVAPDLPEHTDQTIVYDLSPAEQALYNKIRKGLLFEFLPGEISRLENPGNIQNALTKMQVLMQLTIHPDLIGTAGIPSTKMEILKDKLAELLTGNDRKCVVYSNYARRLSDLMPDVFALYGAVEITGSVTNEERQDNIRRFKTDPACQVMLISKAGSEGISLEEAQYLIRLDTPLSIGRDIQLTGRIRRLTSLEPTFSFTLAARGTVDERIIKILKNKQLMNSAVFTAADIKELLE